MARWRPTGISCGESCAGPCATAEHEIRWDPAAGTIDAAELSGVDAVVHLAGENLAGHRWTESFKAQIRDSRVRGTRLLCNTLAGMTTKPAVLVSASAIGYYGDRGDELVDESSPPGRGFLADVCQQWEAATAAARDAGIRVVNLRIGVVLSREGGALAQMLTPFKLGVGGVIGSGRQYISWIALDDLVRRFSSRCRRPRLPDRSTPSRRNRSPTASSPKRSAACSAGRPSCPCRRSPPGWPSAKWPTKCS